VTCRKWGRCEYNLILSNQDNSSQRRRLGRIVHDERGTASVEWHDAPADEARTKLEVEKSASSGRGTRDPLGADLLSIEKPVETFDPYQRTTAPERERKSTGNTTRTDLRKLSEWIKLMRALEEQKKNGGGDAE
jgi:hypothetical protein